MSRNFLQSVIFQMTILIINAIQISIFNLIIIPPSMTTFQRHFLNDLSTNFIGINTRKSSTKLLMMLLIILACLNYNGCSFNYPLSPKGPFYADEILYTSQTTNSSNTFDSISRTYDQWNFSNNPSTSKKCVSLSIQSIQINADSNYLTFYFYYLNVYQTSISFYIYFCQNNKSCFKSVTLRYVFNYLRILAIDYDMQNDESSYNSQLANGIFLQNVSFPYGSTSQVINIDSSQIINIDSSQIDLTQYSFFTFLNGFMLRYQSGNVGVGYSLQVYNNFFNLSVYYQDPNSYSSFDVLFYHKITLQSGNIFKVNFQMKNITNKAINNILFQGIPRYSQYPSQILIYGIGRFYLKNDPLKLETIINSNRNFNATSSFSNTDDFIEIYWLTISKALCPSQNPIYIIDVNDSRYCNLTCQIQEYYQPRLNTCKQCQNSRCLDCSDNTMACISCHSTRTLNNSDCYPNVGYYQNNSTVAASCLRNCSVCENETNCDICDVDHYYSPNLNKCLICNQIFQNCLSCQNTTQASCQICQNQYFTNSSGGCYHCVGNCTSCNDSSSCTSCQTSNYFYFNDANSCLLCSDIFLNCATCTSNASGVVQCSACNNHFLKNSSTSISYNTTCFFTYCGDFIIMQQQEECDDGNNIDLDGCNSQCQIQPGFNCTQDINENYTDYNLSKCFYAEPIFIKHKYLEKDPSQNKVTFRFNLQPKLLIFTTIDFLSQFSDTITVLWDGYTQNTLKVFKIKNALQKNGLYAITFSYQKQWKNVQICFNPANTNLSMFTTTPSSARLLFQTKPRILQTITSQTPTSIAILPQNSDNNLLMNSNYYSLFTLSKFCSFFLVFSVWIYWLIGLFYGKIVVIDFIIVIQLILLCSMTSGELSPSFSGMMLQNFAFYDFTGLFSPDYQNRPIYQSISSQLVAGNISNISIQNLGMWLFITALMLLIGLTAKLLLKIWNSNSLILNIISKCTFGEYLLYSLLPFLLNGSISTVLFMEKIIKESSNILFTDIIVIVSFNIIAIGLTILVVIKSQTLGQFKSHFLRYDISQYFYAFVVIYVTIIGYLFTLIFGTNFTKFASIFVILVFIAIIVFNIYKNPYLQNRSPLRIYILYGIGILLTFMIFIQNIAELATFKQYLPVILILFQLILSLITGYYLYLSVKIDGKPKFDSFLVEYNKKNISIQTDSAKDNFQQVPISFRINSSAINYYQKQSKILQKINKNTLPKINNYEEQYQNLGNQLNTDQNKKDDQQQIYAICCEKNKKKSENLIKSSKFMKMSLKNYLINENFQNYSSNRSIQKYSEEEKYTIRGQNQKNNKNNQIKHQIQSFIKNQNLQEFSEELNQNYQVHDFFAERQKQIRAEKIKVRKQSKKRKKQMVINQPSSPIEQVKQISYFSWVKQLQAEDQQLERAKQLKFKQNEEQ